MFMIQIKTAEMTRFQLLDVQEGKTVRLAFHATMFDTKEQAERVIKEIKEQNPDLKAEFKLSNRG